VDAAVLVEEPELSGLHSLTRLAVQVLNTPVALVMLATDRDQLLISAAGLIETMATTKPTTLIQALCRQLVESDASLACDDLRSAQPGDIDPALREPAIGAYAGFPLRGPGGQVLGSFCVVDFEPRHWLAADLAVLENLAGAAASQIALLMADRELRRSVDGIQEMLASARRDTDLLLEYVDDHRRKDEVTLDEERRRLRQAQKIGRIGSWEWDVTSMVVTWSDTMFDLYGVDPERFTAQQANHGCIHPDDVESMAVAFGQCVQTGEPLLYRYRVIRPSDGQERVFETRSELDASIAGSPRLVGTAMDVTDQMRAQGELASRDAMLRAIIANSQSLIYVKDLDGRYLLANEPFQRAFSVTEAELLGHDDTYLDPALAPVWQANDRRAEQGEYAVEEWSDGEEGRNYYDSVKFPLYDGDDHLYAICCVSLDVTARKKVAETITEARDAALAANAAKSSFLAVMSHEIRTPMNAVIGMTDLLAQTDLDPEQREFVETVRTSGDALLAVINDILDFSRIEAGEMDIDSHPFDLRQCVDDSLSLVAGAAVGLDLVAHVEASCPQFVRGDVNRLRQVLVNLVGNAVKFTPHGDILVSVITANPSTDDATVDLAFSVQDTGIGIPAERIDRLFKSFSQVDASTTRLYGGSGLGLAISRAIIQAMGADITVTSEVDVGSTFSFCLTMERCDDVRPEDFPQPGGCDLNGQHVLVVDDNGTNRRILRLQVEGWGMSCTDTATPGEALALIESAAAFDIAILDMNMPEMDGAALAQRIRALPAGRDLPMIMLTSLGFKPHTAPTGLFAGFHTKPVRAQALRSMLGDVLEPRRKTPRAPILSIPSPRRVSGPERTLRVLLAEDNLVNQRVAQGMLLNLGHLVDTVIDGSEALQALQDRDYDVVLMDIHMPTMDGLEAARAIRAHVARERQPQIVAMTASALPEDRRAATLAGMNGFLLKPVRSADLAKALQAIPAAAAVACEVGPPSDDDPPAVDLEVFDRLIADMGADSPSSRWDVIDAYLEQGDGWVGDLSAAARLGDADRVRLITHTLGSSSALLGALVLAQLLTDVGTLARTDQVDLKPATARAVAEYQRVAADLRAIRDTPLRHDPTSVAGTLR
jgi:PAS domain S-box-containing protein